MEVEFTAGPSMSTFKEHLAFVTRSADAALAKSGFDHLIIASGIEKMRFLDDTPYPFKPNPQFKYWVPLNQHPNSWIAYTPGRKPVLVYYQPDDYWHVPPSAPNGEWLEHFDIRIIHEAADAVQHLPDASRAAIIGEADAACRTIRRRFSITCTITAPTRHPMN
jgi:Xaa-Pro dipeptidase